MDNDVEIKKSPKKKYNMCYTIEKEDKVVSMGCGYVDHIEEILR